MYRNCSRSYPNFCCLYSSPFFLFSYLLFLCFFFFFFLRIRPPPRSPLFPSPPLSRSTQTHASHPEREKGPALAALDVKLDRPTADSAVFDVRRLARGQIDERLEALAAIRAPHRHELLERDPRGGASRPPPRLGAAGPIDATLIETGEPPTA